jgi:predicted DNA-binding protein
VIDYWQEGDDRRVAIGEGKVRKNLVFPPELYDRLLAQAEKEHRQISGLVCYVMEKYLEEKERGKK